MDYRKDEFPEIKESDLEEGIRDSFGRVLEEDSEDLEFGRSYLFDSGGLTSLKNRLEEYYSVNVPFVHLRMLSNRVSSSFTDLYGITPDRIKDYISSKVRFYSEDE